MIRSRIAFALVLAATAIPGIAFAASSAAPSTSFNACGVPFNDLEQGPFARRDYVQSVEPYRVTETDGKHSRTLLEGAVVTVRPAPGVTREWLQRQVEDHMSRMAGAPMSDCPLSVAGATADVSSTGDGCFAIRIHSKDGDAAQEILRRAGLLVAR